MIKNFPSNWLDFLTQHDPSFPEKLNRCVSLVEKDRQEGHTVYPQADLMFAAFDAVAPENVRVWLQGQDPYPGTFKTADGQPLPFAMGLSFSVPKEARLPPTLQNIFKELQSDLGKPRPAHGDLSAWASQGVLLANAQLSVRSGMPNSHKAFGWDEVMQSICQALSRTRPMVFILWGNNAHALEEWVLDPVNAVNGEDSAGRAGPGGGSHCIIKSSHPSNMGGSSKRFFGTKPFSRANTFLKASGFQEIDW